MSSLPSLRTRRGGAASRTGGRSWTCRDVREIDPHRRGTGDLGRAFDAAFGAVDPGFSPRDRDAWEARYGQHPGPAPGVVALDAEGRVAAHWAALGVPARVEGEAVWIGHVVDTFAAVHLTRTERASAFEAVCQRFIQDHCGPRAGRFPLCCGVPVRAAWRLGRALLGYEVVQTMWSLERPAGRPVAAVPAGVRTERVEAFGALEADLHAAASADRALTTTRPAAWLAWRYVPARTPGLALGRAWRADELVGWCAVRIMDLDGVRTARVLDRVALPGDAEAGAALDAWTADLAYAAGAARLERVVAEPSPEFLPLQRAGWRARATGRTLVGRSFQRARDISFYGRQLDWTLADTDLA